MITPAPANLRLQSNYNQLYSALGAAIFILGIATVAVLVMSGGMQELVGLAMTLGVVWFGLVLIFGVTNRRRVKQERDDALALFEEGAWAEWRYTPDEWQQEIGKRRRDLDARIAWQQKMRWVGYVAAVVIVICALLPAIIAGDQMPPQARNFIFLLAGFLGFFTVVLSAVGVPRDRRKWEQNLARAEQVSAPWVRFGPYGFYHEIDGHTILRQVKQVNASSNRDSLTFQIKHGGPRGSTILHPVSLPVPQAHQAELPALVSRYRRERKLGTG
jgi:hypothetical protein